MQESNANTKYLIIQKDLSSKDAREIEQLKSALNSRLITIKYDSEKDTFKIVSENEIPKRLKRNERYIAAYDVTDIPDEQRQFIPAVSECYEQEYGTYKHNRRLLKKEFQELNKKSYI